MASITVNTSGWPLVHTIWPDSINDEDVVSATKILETQCIARQKPWAVVVDMLNSPPLSKSQHEIMNAYTERNRESLRSYCRGLAFVVDSLPVRVSINMFSLISRSPVPSRAFPGLKEAEAWARAQLKAHVSSP